MTTTSWNDTIIAEFRARGGKGVPGFGDRLLLLHNRGARSGAGHITPLAFSRDGEHHVIAASKGGADTHPQWYYNLIAHPEVEVEVGTERFPALARIVSSGPERDRLMAEHARLMPGFAEYERRTARVIPMIVLERLALTPRAERRNS